MARAIDAARIGLDDAPRRRRDVTEVVQDGEALIYEPDGTAKHQLDGVATALWHCLDGSVTLRELSADLEDVLGTDREQAEADVCAYVRALGEAGLLVGVRRHDGPGSSPGRPASTAHGGGDRGSDGYR